MYINQSSGLYNNLPIDGVYWYPWLGSTHFVTHLDIGTTPAREHGGGWYVHNVRVCSNPPELTMTPVNGY